MRLPGRLAGLMLALLALLVLGFATHRLNAGVSFRHGPWFSVRVFGGTWYRHL